MRKRAIEATTILASCAALAGCRSDPPDATQQAWSNGILFAMLILSAIGMIILAGWLTRSVEDKRRRGLIGTPPRRRIDDFAFADQAPLESLCHALTSRRGDLRAEVTLELTRRLPGLPAEELLRIEPRLRKLLYRQIEPLEAELSGAILNAVMRAGDVSALPQVERFLRPVSRRVAPEELLMRAQMCRDVLKMAEEDPGARLLRPSGRDEALLRPVSGAGGSDREILLRPGESCEE